MAFELVASRDVSRMWSAKSERNAKTLRGTNRNIRPEFSRRFQKSERENIGRDHEQSARLVRRFRELFVIVNRSIRCGILHQCAKDRIVKAEIGKIAGDDLNPEWFRASAHDFDGLRVTIVRDEKFVTGAVGGGVMTQGHRLGGGRRFIE